MVKSLTAFAIFSLLSVFAMASPGFAPKSEASEIEVLAKGDRLEVRRATLNCLTQIWPDFSASCLRNTGSAAKVLDVRLVTTVRR